MYFQYISILLEYILHKLSNNSSSLSWQVSIQTLRYLFIQGSVLPTRLFVSKGIPRIATSLKQRQQRRLHCIQDLCHKIQQLAPRKILQQNCYYFSFVINVAGLCTPVKAWYVRTSSCCLMHVELFVGGQLLPQVLYRPSAPACMVLKAVTPFLRPSNSRTVPVWRQQSHSWDNKAAQHRHEWDVFSPIIFSPLFVMQKQHNHLICFFCNLTGF